MPAGLAEARAFCGLPVAKLQARLRFGRGRQGFVQFFLAHASEEIEGLVVVANVFEAEVVILPFAARTLGGAILAGLVTAFPFAGEFCRLGLFFPARSNTDRIEKLGLLFHST
ncbi:hypothetical protein [Devosia riboflavina]